MAALNLCFSCWAQPDALQAGHAAMKRALEWQGAGKIVSAIEQAEEAVRWFSITGARAGQALGQATYLLGTLYQVHGDFQQAEAMFKRSLSVREEVLGPDHEDVAESLTGLADLYRYRVPYLRIEPLYNRALEIRRKRFGAAHASVAAALDSFAAFVADRGETSRAEAMYKEALEITERLTGATHPALASILLHLGRLYRENGRLESAVELHTRAISILATAIRSDDPEMAVALSELAEDLYMRRDIARAAELFQRALAITEKSLGPANPRVARLIWSLAEVHRFEGQRLHAESLYLRSRDILRKTLGENHPWIAQLLQRLAGMYRDMGIPEKAIRLEEDALEIEERNLALIVAAGSEEQKLAYMERLEESTRKALSLPSLTNGREPKAVRLALTTLLRRKGRVAENGSESMIALRRDGNPGTAAMLGQLAAARGRLSASLFQSGSADQLVLLESEVRRIESDLNARSSYFRQYQQPVTIERVQERIPPGALLVEFAAYYPREEVETLTYRSQRFGKRRYGAFVLGNRGAPAWFDVGDARDIDELVMRFRANARNPRSHEFSRPARELEKRMIQPLKQTQKNLQWLILAPSGSLNLVPFAALLDRNERFLIETLELSYLSSGRDLLRFGTSPPPREQPWVFASPKFDLGFTAGAEDPHAADRSTDFSRFDYPPLPGAAEEGQQVASQLPGARLVTGESATEEALKGVKGPAILHIATHGFFLDDQTPLPLGESIAPGSTPVAHLESPLVRSGLVFAGVKQKRSGNGEDGVLTALEAASLDLVGTKLVVLSACDTGVGTLSNGEGVFGLRRALLLAGAQTQVVTLWAVSDRTTRTLMAMYYQGLLSGDGRAASLRKAQKAMIADPALKHPFYWAPFVQSGDWSPLAN
jgi:CHAT domain-containing protein/tetratricopeptide (TPR) repeat protein